MTDTHTIEPNTKTRQRIRHKSKKFQKQYKLSRKIFRTGAFALWGLACLFSVYKSYQPDSNQFNAVRSYRLRREAEATPKTNEAATADSNGKKDPCEDEKAAWAKNPADQQIEEAYFDCLWYKTWSPKCKIANNTSQDYYKTHADDFDLKALDQSEWLYDEKDNTGYKRGSTQLADMCCIGEQRKHSLHNGPIDEFPKTNVFTHDEIKGGFWILHLLCSLYMFAALAIVCDDYFVPALERLSEELSLSEDVAGATFMAAGSSAPELFTSVIGVFVAKSDIGIGTIVGSAVFNILVIIGACGLFVEGDIPLSWWPLFRDSMFYLVTIVCLLIVIYPEFDDTKCQIGSNYQFVPIDPKNTDAKCNENVYAQLSVPEDRIAFKSKCECSIYKNMTSFNLLLGEDAKYGLSKIVLWEAIFLLIMYSLYIVIMKYNRSLEKVFAKLFGYEVRPDEDDAEENAGQTLQLTSLAQEQQRQTTPMIQRREMNRETSAVNIDQAAVQHAIQAHDNTDAANLDFDSAGLRVMMSSGFAPRTRLRMAAKLVAKNQENFVVAKQQQEDGTTKTVLLQKKHDNENNNNNVEIEQMISKHNTNNNNNKDDEDDDDEDDEGPQSPWEMPGGVVDNIKFILAWPITFSLWYTVPQCGKEEFKNLYMISFIVSTVWIAAYSYVMVWMVAYVGFALSISDTIMGLTFLAAGTSVPDTIASILVAQQGLGDMAVSNSIGSNVFDILLGLGLPWTLSMIVARFTPDPPCFKLAQFTNFIVINSSGLVVSVALLLASLIFVVSVIKFSGWKLNTRAGILIGIAYVLFLVGAVYNEASAASSNKGEGH